MAGSRPTFLKATLLLGLLLLSMVAPPVRTFLLVTIPRAASALATPRRLFLFSNLIVVFLAKLSRTTADDDDDQLPHISSGSEESSDGQLAAADYLVHVMMKESSYDDDQDRDGGLQLVDGGGGIIGSEDLPADELKKRVEEFIARFNMERQLEARMLICCC